MAVKAFLGAMLSLPQHREWVSSISGLSPPGLCLAVPEKSVRWCAVSEHEATKCQSFRDHMKSVLPSDGPSVACVKKASHLDCIRAIAVSRKREWKKAILSLSPVTLEQFFTHR